MRNWEPFGHGWIRRAPRKAGCMMCFALGSQDVSIQDVYELVLPSQPLRVVCHHHLLTPRVSWGEVIG